MKMTYIYIGLAILVLLVAYFVFSKTQNPSPTKQVGGGGAVNGSTGNPDNFLGGNGGGMPTPNDSGSGYNPSALGIFTGQNVTHWVMDTLHW